jgi:hypothetical protein
MKIDKEDFIERYVIAFLAAYEAEHYVENCQQGWLSDEQPIEDAYCLADNAWNQIHNMRKI